MEQGTTTSGQPTGMQCTHSACVPGALPLKNDSELNHTAGLSHGVVWVPLPHTQLFGCTGTQPLPVLLCTSILFFNTVSHKQYVYLFAVLLGHTQHTLPGRKTGAVVVVLLFQENSLLLHLWKVIGSCVVRSSGGFTTHGCMLVCRCHWLWSNYWCTPHLASGGGQAQLWENAHWHDQSYQGVQLLFGRRAGRWVCAHVPGQVHRRCAHV